MKFLRTKSQGLQVSGVIELPGFRFQVSEVRKQETEVRSQEVGGGNTETFFVVSR